MRRMGEEPSRSLLSEAEGRTFKSVGSAKGFLRLFGQLCDLSPHLSPIDALVMADGDGQITVASDRITDNRYGDREPSPGFTGYPSHASRFRTVERCQSATPRRPNATSVQRFGNRPAPSWYADLQRTALRRRAHAAPR
jgi:hypothetical protein